MSNPKYYVELWYGEKPEEHLYNIHDTYLDTNLSLTRSYCKKWIKEQNEPCKTVIFKIAAWEEDQYYIGNSIEVYANIDENGENFQSGKVIEYK